MFLNNLKISLRTLRKNKTYTIINMVGLTAGIAAVLLIFRVVNYELGFNKNFQHYDRIVRVVGDINLPDGDMRHSVCIPAPAGELLVSSIPQFEKSSRVKEIWNTLTVPNPSGGAPLKKLNPEDDQTAFMAEPDFLQIFDCQFLAGEAATALSQPNRIVLTQKMAEKCFDRWEDAVGKTILLDNLFPVEVTGVIADFPSDCDIQAPYLVSYSTLKGKEFYYARDDGDWDSCSSNDQVYALFSGPDQMAAANAAVALVGKERYTRDGVQRKKHLLQPLSDLHYNEDYQNSGSHLIPKSRLNVLSAIGLLILALACFNFINLATAQASLRAKEVGVRKTLGSARGQLVAQFMSETGVIVVAAVGLGAALAAMAAPLLRHVSDVPAEVPFLSNPSVLGFLVATAVVVTLLSGLYPSLALAGFQPVQALRSNASKSMAGGSGLRKSLVVAQFAIAQCLIIGAIITIMQLDYIQTHDLGFKKDLVYTFGFGVDSTTLQRQTGLRQSLLQIPGVTSVSLSSDQPFSGNTWQGNFRYGTRPKDEDFSTTIKFADDKYMETYGIKMLAGRWLAPSDTMKEVVVNRTLLTRIGVKDPQEAVGQNYLLWGSRKLTIVGVTEDFHTHSFRQPHLPLTLSSDKEFFAEAGINIRANNPTATVAAIQKAFDTVLPEQVFDGSFLDENVARFYEDDRRLATTCKGFGLLAILISCLGLFGLATHAAQQRVKEIGVRKVLGATTAGIVQLLSKDFLLLVAVALVVASPLAYFLMNKWLEDFVFRIDIKWWVFVLAGVVAVVVAFATVSYQSVKAALANPVKSLRSE
jgi:putative ABC transport system permease protein